MATVSLPPSRRRKPATYGKASRTASSWSTANFHEDDQSALVPVVEQSTAVKAAHLVQRREANPHALKTVKPQEKKSKDSWDVPSSDDEAELSPIKRTSPPKLISKRKLVSLAEDAEPVLAPWEKSKTNESKAEVGRVPRKQKTPVSSTDAQLRAELEACVQEPKSTSVSANAVEEDQKMTTAAARLQAKKQKSGDVSLPSSPGDSKVSARISKRASDRDREELEPTPRKRPRPEETPVDDYDVDMHDVPALPICENEPAIKSQDKAKVMDVYDIPDSSADESAKRKPMREKHTQLRSKRGMLTKYSSPRKMKSAPARLKDMLPSDTETTNTTSRSPSVGRSRPTTPLRTIASDTAASPETAVKASGTLTPKQAALWGQLLPSDNVAPSPSLLHMEDLTLKSRRKPAIPPPRTFNKSSSDVGQRRRTKLVDRLKASRPSTDDEMSADSDDESDPSGLESDTLSTGHDTPNQDDTAMTSQSQSQSQGGAGSKNSLKVTYASRARTYLPEDNFEDNLMLDLQSDIPQRGASASKEASQKSVFDLEDSEDEGGGKLRTIHELRAGGGNQRFRDDIGSLLEDITDHKVSGRSARRSALIELARKLTDEAFTERFLRQSYEQRLVAECRAAPDDVADFALAAAFATMMSGEQPEHVAQSLKDGGVLAWLAGLLDNRADPKKTAKDRRNNMSKSAQAAFAAFVENLAGLESVWSDLKPETTTPRIVALKACDCIVGRLRRSGDKTELMNASEIRQIIPDPLEIAAINDESAVQHIILAVSTLESLSTAALSLNWPSYVIEQLRELLISPHSSKPNSKQLVFLTLRLLTNLTNGNSRNCKAFSQPPVVLHILRMIAEGFNKLYADVNDTQRTINLDVLVLSTGILINLTEYNDRAREQTTTEEALPILTRLVDIFQRGQRRMLEAESEEQGVTNVVYGYLAVVLANLCRHGNAKHIIASRLPNHNLRVLVEALEEFVAHHQRVDTQNFDGEEGAATWSAHTDRLIGVLVQLKAEA